MTYLTHCQAHIKYSNDGRGTWERAENVERAIIQNYNVRKSPRTEGYETPDLKTHPSAECNG